jgi:hypothetical protein
MNYEQSSAVTSLSPCLLHTYKHCILEEVKYGVA